MLLFLLPLATPAGIVAGVAGTLAGYLLARAAGALRMRVGAAVIVAVLVAAAGQLLAAWLRRAAPGGAQATLAFADIAGFGLGGLGLFFGVRYLSARYRAFSVVELGVVVSAVAHTFADHRHHRIHQPRFLSDWAWSHGVDPEVLLAAAGVAALVFAALMLLRTRRAAKLLLTLLLLLVAGGIAFLALRDARIDSHVDTNDLGLTKNEDKSSSSSSQSGQKPPDPVAVALLHDDLPEADVLYFRQAVLSHLSVDRLAADTTGRFDKDVIGGFPSGAPLRVESPQEPAFHRRLHTSMFLLVDHAQPIGLGDPLEMQALENPNPRRFVAAYDVDSMLLVWPIGRLVGRSATPRAWSAEDRRHYTEIPPDPRYLELSERLVRDVDPRFVGDDVMKALAIKRYLEKNGFYSAKEKRLVGNDPTAQFLFGDMRGYCVHFAHAAVFLLRSQGIPARVALGYGVQTNRRGAGSSILIFGHEAHAWPEMYLDGVGWVTFDIYPERSDEPPPPQIDQDLESTLGELARKDKTAGKAADPSTAFVMPWAELGGGLGALVGGALVLGYAVKLYRRLRGASHRLVYRAVLDELADFGAVRRFGETRERHAARVAALAPSFPALTRAHLRCALGNGNGAGTLPEVRALARATRTELRRNLRLPRRAALYLNPIGWCFTR